MSKEFKTCGIVPMLEAIGDKEGESRLTLETMLAFEDNYKPDDCGNGFPENLANRVGNVDGKMTAFLKDGTRVMFSDFRLPDDRLCLQPSAFHLLPSKVLMFLAENQPTEDTEIRFVGGTIVRKQIKEAKK